jgi:hypothetical protein
MELQIGTFTPVLTVVHPRYTKNCCHFCFAVHDAELHRCSACKYVRYCRKQCQLDDWKEHQLDCKHLQGNDPKQCSSSTNFENDSFVCLHVDNLAFMIFKLFVRHLNGSLYNYTGSKTGMKFNQLASHPETIGNNLTLRAEFDSLFENLTDLFDGTKIELDRKLVFDLYCKTRVIL